MEKLQIRFMILMLELLYFMSIGGRIRNVIKTLPTLDKQYGDLIEDLTARLEEK